MLERMKPYEIKMIRGDKVIPFDLTVKITSLIGVLVQESWNKETRSQKKWFMVYASSVDHGIRKCHHVGKKYKVGTQFRRPG
jgi:hypothetical protein